MDEGRLTYRSELFTVRLWPEDLGEGQVEWRGRVQHVLSGRSDYFREWPDLIAFLAQALAPDAAWTNAEIER